MVEFNKEKQIAQHVRSILELVGEDIARKGLLDTPERVARLYLEMFSGISEAEPNITVFDNEEGYDQLIAQRDIPIVSMCEHHLLPFSGFAHVGYIPNDKYLGLSKIVRIVQHFARRPQVQERLTGQIADYIFDNVEPIGVMVVIEAEHACMSIRGVKTPGIMTTTAAMQPIDGFPREEFLSYIRKGK